MVRAVKLNTEIAFARTVAQMTVLTGTERPRTFDLRLMEIGIEPEFAAILQPIFRTRSSDNSISGI